LLSASQQLKWVCLSTQMSLIRMLIDLILILGVFIITHLPCCEIADEYAFRWNVELPIEDGEEMPANVNRPFFDFNLPLVPTILAGWAILIYRVSYYTTITSLGKETDSFLVIFMVNYFIVLIAFIIFMVVVSIFRCLCCCRKSTREMGHEHME
ncbi:hypothetical protein PFISCL1PPCAC_24548, partial [Pristionchus fissidentatus]